MWHKEDALWSVPWFTVLPNITCIPIPSSFKRLKFLFAHKGLCFMLLQIANGGGSFQIYVEILIFYAKFQNWFNYNHLFS